MNPLKAVAAAKDLATHHKAVYRFLGFCNHPNQGFAGSVHGEELDFLQDLVRQANSIEGPLLEIGTLFGFTTQNIALAKDEDKELITVDNFRWNPLGLSSEAHRDFTMRVLNYVCQRALQRYLKVPTLTFIRVTVVINPHWCSLMLAISMRTSWLI